MRREESRDAVWLKGHLAAQARWRAEEAERMGPNDPPDESDEEFIRRLMGGDRGTESGRIGAPNAPDGP